MADLNKIIAPPFEDTLSYESGKCVIYNKKLYKAIKDTTLGEFKSDEWEEVYLFDIVKGGNSDTPTLDKWEQWCLKGGVDYTQYTSLSNLLSNEITVRRLMTIHASADYLYQWISTELLSSNTDTLDIIIANANAMKWIGLRDYICDKMMDNNTIKSTMLESDNWEYILKDHVPVMTSNTAPYGEVTISSYSDSATSAYYAFNNNAANAWRSSTESNPWIQYKFVNPTCVRRLEFKNESSVFKVGEFKLQASNDGSSYIDLCVFNNNLNSVADVVKVNNENYYLYYRIYTVTKNMTNSTTQVADLQFYGRSLNVSVPTMTSNTEPWGEAICSTASSGNEYMPYRAFDKNTSYCWVGTMDTNEYVGYDFGKKVAIKFVKNISEYNSYLGASGEKTIKYQYSDDGNTWTDATSNIGMSNSATTQFTAISNADAHRYWALYILDTYTSGKYTSCAELQFYGVDYSEREFAEGSTVKYLYDHGLEFETMTDTPWTYSGLSVSKVSPDTSNDMIHLKVTTPAYCTYGTSSLIDLNQYNKYFGIIEGLQNYNNNNSTLMVDNDTDISSNTTYIVNKILGPSTICADISSINTTNYLACSCAVASSGQYREANIYELWLE